MSRKKAPSDRIANLTGIRALAALWVVLFHINGDPMTGHRLGIIAGHGSFGVDLFFVLSGFVLSLVYVDRLPARFDWSWYRSFLSRRFAKIYPVHLLAFLGILSMILIGRHAGYRFGASLANTPFTAVLQLLLLNAFGFAPGGWNLPSWSVSAEWFAYTLLFAPIVFTLRRVRVAFVAATAIILWSGFLLFCAFVLNRTMDITSNGILRILPEFFCGYLLYRLVQLSTPRHGDLWALGGLSIILCSCLGNAAAAWFLMPGVMVLLAGLYRGGPVCNRLFGNAFMVLLGEASYSVYMLQTLVFIATKQVLLKVYTGLELDPPALLLFCIADLGAAGLCGWLVFRFFEEPMRQRLLRLFAGSRKNPENLASRPPEGLAPDTQVTSTIG